MRVAVHWTDNAKGGLRAIQEYLEQRADERHVDATIESIFTALDQVQAFPFRAPPWRASDDANFRRLVVGDYVVIYRVEEKAAEARILSVRHQRQHPPTVDEVLSEEPR